jgi:hypothetical protein
MEAKSELLRGERVLVVLDRPRLLGGKAQLVATDRRVIFSSPRNFKDIVLEHISSMGVYTHVESKWFIRAIFAAVVAFFTYAASAFLPQASGEMDLTYVLNFLNFLGTTFLVIFGLLLLVGALNIRRGLFINYSGSSIRFPVKSGEIQQAEQFIKAVRSASRGGMFEAMQTGQKAGEGPVKPATKRNGLKQKQELPPFDPRGLDDE